MQNPKTEIESNSINTLDENITNTTNNQSQDELKEFKINSFYDDTGVWFSLKEIIIKKGDIVNRERRILRKDGSKVYVEMNTKIISDGRMQALIRDITRRKKAEFELEENRELLQKAESIAGLGRFVYHVKSDKWESSSILNKILGIEDYYKKDFKNWLKLIHPDFRNNSNSSNLFCIVM